MAKARPILTWAVITADTIKVESTKAGSGFRFYKANGAAWQLIYTVSANPTYFVTANLATLGITETTDLMARQYDGTGESPDSNTLHIIVEDWKETTSYSTTTSSVFKTLRRVYYDSAVSFRVNTLRRIKGPASILANTLRRVVQIIPTTINADTLRRVINLVPSPLTPDSKSVSFVGQLQPGDVLVIDLKAMTAYLNGINVLDKISGDLSDFVLLAGMNELQYSDDSASRNLSMEIDKRTKYL